MGFIIWEMLMRIHWVLFGLLLAMCGVIGYLLTVEERPFEELVAEDGQVKRTYLGHGFVHPEYPSMNAGGSGQARHEHILWPAMAYGVLTLLIIVALLAFGSRRDERLGAMFWPLTIGGVVWSGIFILTVLSYRGYMIEDSHGLILALPNPAAWFIYVFWPCQFFFVAVYVATFKRAIMTDDDLTRFQKILSEKTGPDGEHS